LCVTFGERVGLVHELRELGRPEELAHRGDRGLGVDQVVRHHGRDVDRAHALLHGALHAEQADAVLVLEQLADRTDAAVAEIVDVVDLALAVLEVDQGLDHARMSSVRSVVTVSSASRSRRMLSLTRPTAERS
jgi:hypothetical protein